MTTAIKQKVYRSSIMNEDVKSFSKKSATPRLTWLTKPRYSVGQVLLALAIVKAVLFLVSHISLNIGWK